jgi:hypothetical protein
MSYLRPKEKFLPIEWAFGPGTPFREGEKTYYICCCLFVVYIYTYMLTCVPFIQIIISGYQVQNTRSNLQHAKLQLFPVLN